MLAHRQAENQGSSRTRRHKAPIPLSDLRTIMPKKVHAALKGWTLPLDAGVLGQRVATPCAEIRRGRAPADAELQLVPRSVFDPGRQPLRLIRMKLAASRVPLCLKHHCHQDVGRGEFGDKGEHA